MEWVRFLFVALLFAVAVIMAVIAVFGIYKFKFVLNRMHAAAMCDTFVLMLALLGVCIFYGFSLPMIKAVLVIVLLWFASPVASHLIARLEVTTNKDLKNECELEDENNE